MIIIGLQECPRCKSLKELHPDYEYIEIPLLALGLGDTINQITHLFGFETCRNCRLRQYKCNTWIPYTQRLGSINKRVLAAKNLAFKNGIVEFPVLANDDLTEIVNG